ncbi:MAG: TonB family protein [Elusimicrobia bacterium]|nr:TonB family protein [Elusimicrobiota bacterium]
MAIHLELRLISSFFTSLALHILILGLYFFLKSMEEKNLTIITDVELIEPASAEPEDALPPAQRAPQSAWEFLKLALPKIKESAPMDVQIEQKKEERRLESMEKLVDTNQNRFRPEAIKLDDQSRAPVQKLSDVMTQATDTKPVKIADLAMVKDIQLEDVGAKRAPAEVVAAIEFNQQSERPRTSLKDIQVTTTKTTEVKTAAPRQALPADMTYARPKATSGAAIATSGLPLGYGKGQVNIDSGPRRGPAAAGGNIQAMTQQPKETKAEVIEQTKKKAVEITGPLSGRKVLKAYLPQLPDWALQEGFKEALVVIRFSVAPDGRVVEGARVEKTSGYGRLDRLAIETLYQWEFAPLGAEQAQSTQWGFITFRFLIE